MSTPTHRPSDPMSQVLLPPHRIPITTPSIFLAGSIEMGKAVDWQGPLTSSLIALFSPSSPSSDSDSNSAITIFNPRRADWNSGWKQDISCPEFKEQVSWELDYIEQADVVALFLQPGTLSPISLLELGLLAGEMGVRREGKGEKDKGKLVVCCPEGYWRRGNVQVVCERYGVVLVETLEEMQAECVKRLRGEVKRRMDAEN